MWGHAISFDRDWLNMLILSRLIVSNAYRLVFKCSVALSAGTVPTLTEVYRGFPQFLHMYARIVPLLGCNYFLPHPFLFII